MKNSFLNTYRSLPWFRGKFRLGKKIFAKYMQRPDIFSFKAHDNIIYTIPNTLENIGAELLINGVYEFEIVQFLKSKINDGSVYFDVGANIGSLALPILKTKENINYHGFEASPSVADLLQQNMTANGQVEARIINKLVHKDGAQELKFYVSNLYGKSSLASTYSSDYIMMDSVSLDEYCKENNVTYIDWLKVDVQGFELYVFEGMQELLQNKKVKNILFEIEDWAEQQAGLDPGSAKNYLQKFDYHIYSLEGKPWDEHKKAKDTMIWARPVGS